MIQQMQQSMELDDLSGAASGRCAAPTHQPALLEPQQTVDQSPEHRTLASRSWSDLPEAIAAAILRASVADGSTKVARLVCRHWRAMAEASVQHVKLKAWPPHGAVRPLSVALPNLQSLALMGSALVDVEGRRLETLLADLGQLTGLTGLQLCTDSLCTVTTLQLANCAGIGRGHSISLPVAVARLQQLQRLEIGPSCPHGASLQDFADLSNSFQLPAQLPQQLTELVVHGALPSRRHLTSLTALQSLSMFGWQPAMQMAVHLHKLPALTHLSISTKAPSDPSNCEDHSFVSLQATLTQTNEQQLAYAVYGELVRCAGFAQEAAEEEAAGREAAAGQLPGLASLRLCLPYSTIAPPEEFCAALSPTLTALDLSGSPIVELPRELSKLTALQVLCLQQCRIKAIDACILALSTLRELDVSDCRLVLLPHGLSSLSKLAVLRAGGNAGLSLEAGVFERLGALTCVELCRCRLNKLPEVSGMQQLQVLDISRNRLAWLPVGLEGLTALTCLKVHENPIVSPLLTQTDGSHRCSMETNSIRALSSLRHLSIGSSSATQRMQDTLPPLQPLFQPGDLRSLRQLDACSIGRRQAEALLWIDGSWVCSLRLLTGLDLAQNELTCLPEGVGQLTALEHLMLRGNQIISLPDTMSCLVRLRVLDAAQNGLTALPAGFSCLMALETLLLHGNQIKALPAGLHMLMELSDLDLSHNKLACLPAELAHMPALHTLSIAGNRGLTALPTGLSRVPCLAHVAVNHALEQDPEIKALAQQQHRVVLRLLWNPQDC